MSDQSFQVTLRFYAELQDFLHRRFRKQPVVRTLNHRTTVMDVIESCGVPHTEVELVLVNGTPVDFDHHVNPGDHLSVYPVFESLDVAGVPRPRPKPLRDLSFAADAHLGKLARRLRLLGFDVRFQPDVPDDQLVSWMHREGRIILTRDRALLMRREVTRGYLVRSSDPATQTVEVVRRFDLLGLIKPFSRCPNCNGVLEAVPKEEILDRLEPLTKKYFNRFSHCRDCQRIYWRGSHHQRVSQFIQWVRDQAQQGQS